MSDAKYEKIIQDDTIISKTSQDVSEVLKFNKEKRLEQTDCKADLHHVARVPYVIIEKLINEGRLNNDCLRDKDQMAKAIRIIAAEYPAFMATDKKVLK